MPNHITNQLRFEGPGAHEVMFAMLNKKGLFDFRRIIPIPDNGDWMLDNDTVIAMASLMLGNYPEAYFSQYLPDQKLTIDQAKAWIRNKTGDKFERYRKQAVKVLKDVGKYGTLALSPMPGREAWGTKWNAYSQSFPFDVPARRHHKAKGKRFHRCVNESYVARITRKRAKKFKMTSVEFDTAWSTPEPIWNAIALRLPDGVTAHVRFADEDLGSNCGEFSFNNKGMISSNIAPSWRDQTPEQRREWTKFAFHICRGEDAKPEDWGMNDQYEYVDEE